jgi:hypothetical protein
VTLCLLPAKRAAGAILECRDPATGKRADYAMIVRDDSYNRSTMCVEGPNLQFPLKNFELRGLEVRYHASTSVCHLLIGSTHCY